MKKLTQEEFLDKARVLFPEYDYTNTVYTGRHGKIRVICKEHGEFIIEAGALLSRHGCLKCGLIKQAKSFKEKYANKFLEDAKEKHGDRYDYSLVEYKNAITPVKIICREHGVFEQTPVTHLNSNGCPVCGRVSSSQKQSKYAEFKSKAREVHGDKYDYSLVNYVNNRTKVKIICPEHGEFEQAPQEHLRGHGCIYCGGTTRFTTSSFLDKAREVHGDKYDYSLVNYVNNRTKVKIICPEHGIFEQKPVKHLVGHSCPLCSGNLKYTKDDFVKISSIVHHGIYDYSMVHYTNNKTKVKIICPKHGVFEQKPDAHLQGHSCPICNPHYSRAEKQLADYVKSIYSGEIIENDRKLLDGKEIDVYIPDKKVAIEYNGLFWHCESQGKTKFYHLEKTQKCAERGVRLIHIFEDQWRDKQEICKSIIASALGIYKQKVFARKCEVKQLSRNEYIQFLNENHLQGSRGGSIAFGNFYNGELLQAVVFGKSRFKEGEIELIRMVTKKNTQVVGGFTKLLKHSGVAEFYSYADRAVYNASGYLSSGFSIVGESEPAYFYFKKSELVRLNRVQFQKHKLADKLEIFDPDKSEADNMYANGYERFFDCGCVKLFWKNN